jgi:hypothetical protein
MSPPSEELEPADALARDTRMPRSLCAFALKLSGYESVAARALLDRVLVELPAWPTLPQGVLFKQVQALSGYQPVRPPTASVPAFVPPPAAHGDDDDIDIELHEETPEDHARSRGIRDAAEVLARGALEYRAVGRLEQVPAACPACQTLRLLPTSESPTRSCPTCGGPMVLSFTVGLAAGSEELAYCEAFNARVNEHIRENIDASFDAAMLTPLAGPDREPEPEPTLAEPAAPLTPEATELELIRPGQGPSTLPHLAAVAQGEGGLLAEVLAAEDWRTPLAGVPFELEALKAVHARAEADVQHELAAGIARHICAGEPDADLFTDCPRCLQSWRADDLTPDLLCPTCQGPLLRHDALEGELDEAGLAYQSAYNDAVRTAVRVEQPHFAFHLLHEAPGSILRRLARTSGMPEPVCDLAMQVSAGDDAQSAELLGWLKQRLSAEGLEQPPTVEAAQAALAEIGAEPDEAELSGRQAAEAMIQQGQLGHHASGEPCALCPVCLQRFPGTEASSPCPSCAGPLIDERDFGLSSEGARDAFNARMERQLRSSLAPSFSWDQVSSA